MKIEDYAVIGDTHSAALVSKEGSIDWLCLPRFDSPSCFGRLLDPDRGGHWLIAPTGEVEEVTRRYVDDTMVLETTFRTSGGVVRIVDLLALEETSDPDHPRAVRPEEVLVRVARCDEGAVDMRLEYAPRFDYAGIVPWFRERHLGIEAVGGPDALDLVSNVPLRLLGDHVAANFTLAAGESASFLAGYHPSHIQVRPRRPEECEALTENSLRFWRSWAAHCHYEGPSRDRVLRSLLTLKSLTYGPTGGLIAAATTSLPEKIGGVRNWDYRYCWLRDATFTLEVLLEQGYTGEAAEWRDWLLRSVAGDPDEMQIMYGVMGERRLLETELHLSGYEGSVPVRIGNAAHQQFQLDVYGEVMDSFHSARRAGIDTPTHAWALEKVIVDFVCEHWDEPDEGIWEVRSGREHFVHSKVMAWVAVDRGIKAIEHFGEEGPVERWRRTREQIRAEVLERGVDEERGCFRRSYDKNELDASLLMLPFVGFEDADDPLMRTTIEAIGEDLMVDGFLLRYRSDLASDGLPPGEGAFLMCTFWYLDCLVLLGRIDEAREIFERTAAVANDVGLLAEQFDPVERRLLGNFPQAFSHVALVTSALALDTAGTALPMQRGRA